MKFQTLVLLGILICSPWILGVATAAQASYDELMEKLHSFQESRVLLTAIELDIFTAVGQGATPPQVAARIHANQRSTETFLNALVAMGALTKKDDVFHNTPAALRYLIEGSPDSERMSLLHTAHMWKAWNNLTGSVRDGTAIGYQEMADRDDEWTKAFITAMHRGALEQAGAVVKIVGTEGVLRLLDVGGGSGAYSIAFAKANARLRAEVLDLPKVVPIAQRYIEEAGVADRITTRVGDLRRDTFGRDYNLIFLSAICHMLSPEENKDLFRRCYRALAPRGRIVIRDFFLEPGKTAPKWVVLFALNMLVGTQGGGCYTGEEYTAWLREAGCQEVELLEPSSIIAGRR
jgi:predicted O-methyltransferase YrrM